MKKLVTQEIECCDKCEKEYAYYKCDSCAKVYCGVCKKTKIKQFKTEIHVECSSDPKYCYDCLEKEEVKNSEIVKACQVIDRLDKEYIGFYEDFKKRQAKAEAKIKQLIGRK